MAVEYRGMSVTCLGKNLRVVGRTLPEQRVEPDSRLPDKTFLRPHWQGNPTNPPPKGAGMHPQSRPLHLSKIDWEGIELVMGWFNNDLVKVTVGDKEISLEIMGRWE
jgi:hypothetical protein